MSLKCPHWFPKLKLSFCLIAFFSSAFQAFGMYNIHALSGVTEGGVLGMTLLLEHWFSVSPALSGTDRPSPKGNRDTGRRSLFQM